MDAERTRDLALEAEYWKQVLQEVGEAHDQVGVISDLSAKTIVNLATIAMSSRDSQWASVETAMAQTGQVMSSLLTIQKTLNGILDLTRGRAKVLTGLLDPGADHGN